MLAIFETIDDATQTISNIIGAGIVPAALELMDQGIVSAVEQAFHFGFPLDAGAVLLIEVDGLREEVEAQSTAVQQVCQDNRALSVRLAKNDAERAALWAGRKGAFAAIGRLTADYYTVDGVVYLRGRVQSLDDTDLAAEIASRIPGVNDVVDEMTVEA